MSKLLIRNGTIVTATDQYRLALMITLGSYDSNRDKTACKKTHNCTLKYPVVKFTPPDFLA